MNGAGEHADLAAFAETAAHAVRACAALAPPAQARLLAEAGLLGILAPEAAGGLGLDLHYAVPVMAAAAGGLLGFPLAETMLLAAALATDPAGPALAAGTLTATIAWTGTATRSGGRLHGTVGRAPAAEGCDAVLVRLPEGAALLRLNTPGVTLSDGLGLDVDAPEFDVVLDGAAPVAGIGAGACARLDADALVLRTAAIMGSAETCLAMAAEHTAARRQFGRKLVAFQALRHAMARQKLAVESLRGALTRCLDLAPEDELEALPARQAAFAAAARLGPAAIESALQLHGGMGFTWDLPLHRHLRRVRSLEAQGDAPGVHAAIAAALLDTNA